MTVAFQGLSARPRPGRLVVRTVPIAEPDDLLARLPDSAAVAWVRRGEGLVGWGTAARVVVPAGVDRFGWARAWLDEVFAGADVDDSIDVPGTGPVAFGSFTFAASSPSPSVLILPRAVLGRRGGAAWFTTIGDGADPLTLVRPVPAPAPVRFTPGALSPGQWRGAVAAARDRIRAGELAKVVLARDLRALAGGPIDGRRVLRRLAARYPDCYTFACAGLVGATPELLARRVGDRLDSLVLAGTTARGATPAEDAARGTALLASAKDVEEHAYAVTSVREVLAPLCTTLTVDPRPGLLVLANVAHLATAISGRLGTSRSVLDVVAALHPTAAVGGTPASVAVPLIQQLERMDRGRYAGPVGWVDARGNGEWGIALRCAELDGARARLFAGGGIVAGSDPAAELAETESKFAAMREAIAG